MLAKRSKIRNPGINIIKRIFLAIYKEIGIQITEFIFQVSSFKFQVYFGRHLSHVPNGSWVIFPFQPLTFCCGISGIICFKSPQIATSPVRQSDLDQAVSRIETHGYESCIAKGISLKSEFLGGQGALTDLQNHVEELKTTRFMQEIFSKPDFREILDHLFERLNAVIQTETRIFNKHMGELDSVAVEILLSRIELIRDIAWRLQFEVLRHIDTIRDLMGTCLCDLTCFQTYRNIDAVLSSLDRLEVRGRDSAGISVIFRINQSDYNDFNQSLARQGLSAEFSQRVNPSVLSNRSIGMKPPSDSSPLSATMAFTYKVAAEIGSLGDNVAYIRQQIREDAIFRTLIHHPCPNCTISAHTRWASVGAITLPNCHPTDNASLNRSLEDTGIIHACLNGDIDNYRELIATLESEGIQIPSEITTDTKIIPLLIEKHVQHGLSVEDAFRSAVNQFHGSHAIIMHTDLAPGKLFLAQKGSGQALFVGMGASQYMPASEVYGFIEETPYYVKIEGEKTVQTQIGTTQGQIFILNQNSNGGLSGIHAMYYDGTPVLLDESHIQKTEITSRDIDRQNYPHYFLKEISEAPASVERTLVNRWRLNDSGQMSCIDLNERVIPQQLKSALMQGIIRRIWFIGQGTAGVAAQACADILTSYLGDSFHIMAMKSSELSGFRMPEPSEATDMSDTLVIAISQSGTTADTNRTVDMVQERGAFTLAIVNRRDSDLTFKVNGVMYTSSGRDIEMSVASTKAFYGQIVAGSLLGLYLADALEKKPKKWIAQEIQHLLALPNQMRQILAMTDSIRESADRLALSRIYWAVVGSGNNKASADEIRIKLSELCYKTISSDYVEDKKHIDLSSEPLILVCAAGSRQTVIGDIIKDTAIFKAHKSAVIVIADQGENRFDADADDVFHVPSVPSHLSPILNTLVGHIWGYHAALAIHGCSRFLYEFREDLLKTIESGTRDGMDVYEIVLEKSFREKIATFYYQLRQKRLEKRFCTDIGGEGVRDLPLLLKYLSGRLPVADFEMDFGRKGTARNMIDTLMETLGLAINLMARPIDAIKHQAKTVTVGTSRLLEKLEGILFDILEEYGFNQTHLTHVNVQVLKNLQGVIHHIDGAILYRIHGLNVLGEPTETTTIHVIQKSGTLAQLASRVETDPRLKGTKRIIAREGNVFIGRGHKDGRSIVIIPILSGSPPNVMNHQLLLHIVFHKKVPLDVRIRALGGKLERLRNIVQENSVVWKDVYLERVRLEDLFGQSAEKTGEFIVSSLQEE